MDVSLQNVTAAAYRIPTDAPEADGTICWNSTVLVVVHVEAGGKKGMGYTYAAPEAAGVASGLLGPILCGRDAFAVEGASAAMVEAVRNIGWRGIAANAISAIDVALWDLKAKLLDCPLHRLFGPVRSNIPIYGSGGFTSYDDGRLADQLGRWVREDGCRFVKMKIGAEPEDERRRMEVAKKAIGDAALMIDANGAYSPKQALRLAETAAALDVVWFEEPVTSDDLEGLSLLRKHGPAGMDIAAGEYGYEPIYFRRMLEARCVDVLQVDATRCCGYTGFLRAAALADAFCMPLSAHTAPALHLPVCCAAPGMMHMEWFHDHVRIEKLLFEGVPTPAEGTLLAGPDMPGHGLTFKTGEAGRYAIR
ncbi:MAG: enolase C-terminal domain-like protein [Pseudorhizobium sp.]